MYLKKLYEKDDAGNPVKVSGVKLLERRDPETGKRVPAASVRQKFTPRKVFEGTAQGWMSVGQGKITVHTENQGDLVYRIEREPGIYCCHCGSQLPDQVTARGHVSKEHAGEKSPDSNNPAGYEDARYFDCVLETEL